MEAVSLPEPRYDSEVSLEEALLKRRSVRRFADEPLTLTEVSQLGWAAQGITGRTNRYRNAPSAGALCPLELYFLAGNIQGLSNGAYKYNPEGHELFLAVKDDIREDLASAASYQNFISEAPATFIIAAVYEKTTIKYGERGIRYVHMEAGHAAQNIYLQATALGLGTIVVGAFDDEAVKSVLKIADEEPLYIMPTGRPLPITM